MTVAMALLFMSAGFVQGVVAGPSNAGTTSISAAQNVDWLSPDSATYLAGSGIDVLVPSWVPDPFGGFAPELYAGGGTYSLYWIVTGGAPTFLQITGTAGGGMPAGSPADLNVQLSINADVQGYDAIHDIGIPEGSDTPIYDQVWWVAGGVLYTVSSNNMTGSDSLSLANSLISLAAPAPELPTEPAVVDEPISEPTVDEPTSEPVSDEPTDAPVVDEPTSEPVVEEPTSEPVDTSIDAADTTDVVAGDASEPAETTVDQPVDQGTEGTTAEESAEPDAQPTEQSASEAAPADTGSASDATDSTETSGNDQWSPGKYDVDAPSDGTSGAQPPVLGGDGTGGTQDNSVPRIPRHDRGTP